MFKCLIIKKQWRKTIGYEMPFDGRVRLNLAARVFTAPSIVYDHDSYRIIFCSMEH